MLDPVENSMTTSAHSKASLHGQIAPLMTLASATAAVRVGTLAALIPGLVAAHVGTGTWLTLALHIAGALATVVVILVQSRAGLLMAVLYTGYSTVVLALNAPNGALSSVMWIDFADDPRVLAKSTSKAESVMASLDRTIGRDRGIRGVVNPALITGSS